jgi:uncharacterized protein (TIGR00266 family)
VDKSWYYARGQERVGPLTLEELARQLPAAGGERALVYGPGMTNWIEARHSQTVMAAMGHGSSLDYGGGGTPPPPPRAGKRAHEIEYEIYGEEMQFVEVILDPGETVIAEAGGMMYMASAIQMETVFGDPSAEQKQGFLGKVMTAGKRALTGESLFMTTFTNAGQGKQKVAFASPYPGKIIAMDLHQLGGEIICQKDSFLCAAKGVTVGIAFRKKIGVGLFGGEGFIMQRLAGDGLAMVHAGGTLVKRTLRPGELLKLDTGCLVAMQPSVQYDVQFVGGIKNTLFGGEGLFFATLTGPGDVWLQSLPFSRLAGRIIAAAGPVGGKGEGSVLGGLGRFLDGDNS